MIASQLNHLFQNSLNIFNRLNFNYHIYLYKQTQLRFLLLLLLAQKCLLNNNRESINWNYLTDTHTHKRTYNVLYGQHRHNTHNTYNNSDNFFSGLAKQRSLIFPFDYHHTPLFNFHFIWCFFFVSSPQINERKE